MLERRIRTQIDLIGVICVLVRQLFTLSVTVGVFYEITIIVFAIDSECWRICISIGPLWRLRVIRLL